MEIDVKNQKILEKIRFESNVFFDCIFLWILGGFWEGLGRVLGGVWEGFGASWAIFDLIF